MDYQFTAEQYESLGKLIARNCGSSNRASITVSKELAGPALMVVISHSTDDSVTYGIEKDGYTHT